MFESNVPSNFSIDPIATTNYLINRLPKKNLNYEIPLKTLSRYLPIPPSHNLQPRAFGCIDYGSIKRVSTMYVHIPKHKKTKLNPCVVNFVFVGYEIHKKGYRCFDAITSGLYTNMGSDFQESELYEKNHSSGQGENTMDSLGWLICPNLSKPPNDPSPIDTTNTTILTKVHIDAQKEVVELALSTSPHRHVNLEYDTPVISPNLLDVSSSLIQPECISMNCDVQNQSKL